jgi:SAM-dependent methyltransferase
VDQELPVSSSMPGAGALPPLTIPPASVAARSQGAASVELPRILNIGSGKNFRDSCLNIDVSPYWQPDIVADLNQPFPGDDALFETDRFGRIQLLPGSFDAILAVDVLEHLEQLQVAMKSCLDLLRVGGVFQIQVPYELSTGAWSDPTHVRAFNERSWLYWTEWVWYVGWTEHRFELGLLHPIASELGLELEEQGVGIREILRTPRAIDAMYVELRKIEMSEEERRFVLGQRDRGVDPNLEWPGDR